MTTIRRVTTIYICPHCDSPVVGSLYDTASYNTFGSTLLSNGSSVGPCIPGTPDKIVRCPDCKEIFYLDRHVGKYENLNDLDEFGIHKRRKERLHLLDDPKEIEATKKRIKQHQERVERNRIPKKWADAPYKERLTHGEIAKALDDGLIENKDHELRERIHLWWSLDGIFRVVEGARDNFPQLDVPPEEYNKKLTRMAVMLGVDFSSEEVAQWNLLVSKYAHIRDKNMERILDLLSDSEKDNIMRGEILRRLGRFDDAIEVFKSVKVDYKWITDQMIEFCEAKDTDLRKIKRNKKG